MNNLFERISNIFLKYVQMLKLEILFFKSNVLLSEYFIFSLDLGVTEAYEFK